MRVAIVEKLGKVIREKRGKGGKKCLYKSKQEGQVKDKQDKLFLARKASEW